MVMEASTIYPAVRRPTLYRYFDAKGDLLYVGVTVGEHARLLAHAGSARWWLLAASCTLVHFETEEEMYAAERLAIRTENPPFNHHDNPAWYEAYREQRRAEKEARRIAEAAREAERAKRARLRQAWRGLMRLAASGAPIE